MPQPQELQIVGADAGVYLLYCDSHGQSMTDTFHLSVRDALRQAEFEFSVSESDWTLVE